MIGDDVPADRDVVPVARDNAPGIVVVVAVRRRDIRPQPGATRGEEVLTMMRKKELKQLKQITVRKAGPVRLTSTACPTYSTKL